MIVEFLLHWQHLLLSTWIIYYSATSARTYWQFMAKETLLRWIALLKKPQDSLSQNDFNVFVISDCQSPNEVSPLLKQYFPNFIINKKLKDFSLWQLIFGSLHFAGHPSKKNLSFYEKLKRIIVRVFFLWFNRKV